jgi:hypothetical protein
MLQKYQQLQKMFSSGSGARTHAVVIVTVMAFIGFVGVYGIQAATYSVNKEAEQGTLTGNASLTGASTASGGNSVLFGLGNAAPATPTALKTFTGGTSIALRWDGSAVNNAGIKQYNIFRNGSQVGTVTPGFHADFPEKDGNGYIDNNVTRGATYSYQVQAVSTTNTTSALSTSVSATHPTTTTATPTITVDYSTAPDLASYMQSAKAFLLIWWPKVGDAIARPEYQPKTSFKIVAEQGYNGLAGTTGGADTESIITISADYARQVPHDYGVWIHEATHIIQLYPSSPIGWANEGMADSSREYMLRDRDPYPPRPGDSYTQGYSQASFFLNWIQSTYSPTFIHKLNVALHNGTYTDSFFPNNTGGKTIDQLWAELTAKSYSPAGQVTGIANKCLDIASGVQANGTKTQLYTCNGLDPQKWRLVYGDISQGRNGIFSLHAYNTFCLDIQNGGTAAGTITWLYTCSNGEGAQQWKIGANNSLVNPKSGRCLSTTGGTSEDGNQLIIADCNGSTSQRWILPN